MKKIKKYELVSDTILEWLNKKVNKLIESGYQPLGNPQIIIHTWDISTIKVCYSQVMVIYEEDSEQKE